MTTNNQKEIDFSLSDEEKDDLDRMIQDFNQKRNAQLDRTDIDNVHHQLKAIQDSFEQLSDIVEGLPKGKFASVLVRRNQGPEFIAIRIPE